MKTTNTPPNAHGLFSDETVFAKFLKDHTADNKWVPQVFRFQEGKIFNFRQRRVQGLYYIESGVVKVDLLTPIPRALRLAAKGDLIGYGSWLITDDLEYQLTALVDCELQFWTCDAVKAVTAKNPEFNRLITEHLIRVIQYKDERIAALESQSAEERVIRLVLGLVKKFGKRDGLETVIDLYLDRQSLAQLSGTAPETFSRIITSLEDKGLVWRRKRHLLVPDVSKLTQFLVEKTR